MIKILIKQKTKILLKRKYGVVFQNLIKKFKYETMPNCIRIKSISIFLVLIFQLLFKMFRIPIVQFYIENNIEYLTLCNHSLKSHQKFIYSPHEGYFFNEIL